MHATATERNSDLADQPGLLSVRLGTEAVPRTRISRSRALGLALPGLLLLDALMVTGCFLLAVQMTFGGVSGTRLVASAITPPLLALYVVLASGFLLLAGMLGLYSRRSLHSPSRTLAAAARAVFWSGLAAVVFGFLLALDPPADLRQLLLTHAMLLAVGALTLRPLACRLLVQWSVVGSLPERRVLVLGQGYDARRVAAALELSDPGAISVVGLAGREPQSRGSRWRWPRFQLGDWSEAGRLAHGLAAEEIVIATRRIPRGESVQLAVAMARAGVRTSVVPHLTRLLVDGAPVMRCSGVPILRIGSPNGAVVAHRVKRAADVVLTSAGLLACAPLMAAIALLVKLGSPGPVLYSQTRIGQGGQPFRMYKFRSMTVSNDDTRHRKYVTDLMSRGDAAGFDASGRPIYKLLDDPRITFFGKLLRRTSLDELPQLFNVLWGEMSLVGPRPCLPFEFDLYADWQKHRLDSVPGMTGLWQVSGRSFLSFEEMVLLDLYYHANWSLSLDLRLLWRTIPEVLGTRGTR